MALDPNLLNTIANPTIPKLDDPLEKYNNFLLASSRMSGLREERRKQDIRNALIEGYRQNTDADGNVNWPGLRSYAAQNKIGDAIPDISEGELKLGKMSGEVAKLGAETGKVNAEAQHEGVKMQETGAKAFEQAMTNARGRMADFSHDPKVGVPQMANWIKEQFADPIIGGVLRARGATPETMIAEMNQTLQKVPFDQYLLQQGVGMEKASKKNITTINAGDHIKTIATPEHSLGVPMPQTVSDDAVGIDPGAVAKARAGAANVSVNVQNIAAKGDTAYTQEWNRNLAADDGKLKAAADSAPDLIRSADEALAILKKGKVITGFGAGPRLAGEKVLNTLTGGRVGNTELIRNTETLGSKLAANTLAHIKSSGLAGSAGLTEGERGFLEDAVAGRLTWNNESLQEMQRLARKQGERTIQRWQSRYNEIGGTGIQGRTYPDAAPTAPPAKGSFAEAVAYLKKNPGTAAAFERRFNLPPGSAKQYIGR